MAVIRRLLDSYKVYNQFYCLCLTLYAMVILDQIFVYFVGFLSMVIYVVSLYTRCLRYNKIICSAWFLDIRISTCSNLFSSYTLA